MSPVSPVCRSNSKHERRGHETGRRFGKPGDFEETRCDDGVGLGGSLHSINIFVGQPHRQRPGALDFGQVEVAAHRELPSHPDGFGGSGEIPGRQALCTAA